MQKFEPSEDLGPEGQDLAVYEPEKLYREQEVLQEEIIASMPPLAHLLLKKQYDLKYFYKIPLAILIILIIYFVIGLDALLSGAVFFIFWLVIGYIYQQRNISKDVTYFFECKKAGQIIPKEYSPYSRTFWVEFDRTALWAVPNSLIKKGLFKIPGESMASPLPANPGIIFVDLFDPKNRTCVLPFSPDVANICLDANMNPTMAKMFDEVAENLDRYDMLEKMIIQNYSRGIMSRREAERAMQDLIKTRNALFDPNKRIKRDIFFHLQKQIPVLQDSVRFLKEGMLSLADSYVAETIYKLLKRPIPANIEQNINKIREKFGAPKVGEYDEQLKRLLR